LEKKTTKILRRHQFAEDGIFHGDPKVLGPSKPVVLPENKIKAVAERLGGKYSPQELLRNPLCFEDPA